VTANAATLPEPARVRLQSHFAMLRLPFRKTIAATDMFDSRAQRELYLALSMWSELHGIALVTGPSGAGKSITVRRFARALDESRFRVVTLSHGVSTVTGFLRSLNRALELPMRQHASDLFDQAQAHLAAHAPGRAPHPVVVIDDAEGMPARVLDTVRRLTSHAIDAEDRFSVVVAGTPDLLRTLRDPALEPFNTRLSFVHALKPFNLEDTRNYVAFHLRLAGAREGLLADGAVRKLFQASGGVARRVNQLALHAMVQAAVAGLDTVSAEFMATQLEAHPLYDSNGAG
jgi:type II secretory pathway predicted ATPase ExeA